LETLEKASNFAARHKDRAAKMEAKNRESGEKEALSSNFIGNSGLGGSR
jgi:hypothetical protein